MDNFLVIGSGSAGRRHALCLRYLYPTSRISIVKRSVSYQPLDAIKDANISVLTTINEGLQMSPDFTVVASPSPFHSEDLEQLSKSCTSFLLEKPIAAKSQDGSAIQALVESRGLRVTVGYHLRFSETPLALVLAMSALAPATPTSISLSYGQHLRHWRPGIAPEQSVTAVKELGGGVLRELSHEIDAVSYLLGDPSVAHSAFLRFSDAPTDGRVETQADFILSRSTIDARLHLDMTTDVPYRHWDIKYPTFTLRANLLRGSVTRIPSEGPEETIFVADPGERDRAARALLNFAVTASGNSQVGACEVAQGLRILNTIEAIEKSAMHGKPVSIEE